MNNKPQKMRALVFVFLSWIFVVGCSAHAIIPAKLTYTYPPAEPMAYETDAAFGAIAFVDERTFDLYLPYFNETLRTKPKRFVFIPTDKSNVHWMGKPARSKENPDIEARFVLEPEALKGKDGEVVAQLDRGALVIVFPKNETYKGLAGQMIWLTPSVGWNEVFHIRGLYLKSPSKLPESVGFKFSREDE